MNTPIPSPKDPVLDAVLYAISLCTDDHPALEDLDMAYNALLMSKPLDQQDAVIAYTEGYLGRSLDYQDLLAGRFHRTASAGNRAAQRNILQMHHALGQIAAKADNR